MVFCARNCFRAKRKESGGWAFGDLAHLMDGTPCLRAWGDREDTKLIEIDADTLSMSTGLCDHMGNCIFDGDILVREDSFGECDAKEKLLVVWRDTAAGFVMYHVYDGESDGIVEFDDLFCDKVEIVGNIFDNEELLEGANG